MTPDLSHAGQGDGLLDEVEHPNGERYPNQRVMVVECDSYAYLVPYVEDEDHMFLKTVIPSRKATREYLAVVRDNTEGGSDE